MTSFLHIHINGHVIFGFGRIKRTSFSCFTTKLTKRTLIGFIADICLKNNVTTCLPWSDHFQNYPYRAHESHRKRFGDIRIGDELESSIRKVDSIWAECWWHFCVDKYIRALIFNNGIFLFWIGIFDNTILKCMLELHYLQNSVSKTTEWSLIISDESSLITHNL